MKNYLNGKTIGLAKTEAMAIRFILLRQQPLEQGQKQMKTKCYRHSELSKRVLSLGV